MKRVENDRLIKALIISFCFHGFLFFGMNLFNWFPKADNTMQYGPITVILEKPNSPIVKTDNPRDQIIEKEITKNEDPLPSVNAKREDVSVQTDTAEDIAYDPYADIGESSDTAAGDTPIETPGDVNQDTAYVPVVRDSIEFEVPVKGESGGVSPNQDTDNKTKKTNPIISSGDISELENALSSDNNNNNNLSPSSESDKTVYHYNDSPVDFDTQGINRKLISSPSPELPADLPADFPSEIIYKIRFSLNTDGLIKVLSISPPPLYPKVESSIRNALRSWTFNQSTGTEDVKGTITLIFKGR